jgi:hypothetical protein
MTRSGPAGIHCYQLFYQTAHSKFAADNQGLFEAHSSRKCRHFPTRPDFSYLCQALVKDAGPLRLKQEKG